MTINTHQSDPHQRARLKWRARRGLLENDLMLSRYLQFYEESMTDEEVYALDSLLALTDNDLLDLLLARTLPKDALNNDAVCNLLKKIRYSPINLSV